MQSQSHLCPRPATSCHCPSPELQAPIPVPPATSGGFTPLPPAIACCTPQPTTSLFPPLLQVGGMLTRSPLGYHHRSRHSVNQKLSFTINDVSQVSLKLIPPLHPHGPFYRHRFLQNCHCSLTGLSALFNMSHSSPPSTPLPRKSQRLLSTHYVPGTAVSTLRRPSSPPCRWVTLLSSSPLFCTGTLKPRAVGCRHRFKQKPLQRLGGAVSPRVQSNTGFKVPMVP